MKALAPRSNVQEAPLRARDRTRARAVPPRAYVSHADASRIQRKAACACGGGCPGCQTKSLSLPVSRPDDAAEVEADRAADLIMRMSSPDAPPFRDADAEVRRKAERPGASARRADHRDRPRATGSQTAADSGGIFHSAGKPLDAEARSFFEPRFGHDFGHVRIHHDAQTASFAEGIEARAFTVGSNIGFAPGQFQPSTAEGKRLLAHELTHVFQQQALPALGKKIQRDDAPAPGTAAAAPRLEFQAARNGEPCACLIVIHNNEKKARETAELMHKFCTYNLLLLNPNDGERDITLPGHDKQKCDLDPKKKGDETCDPNALFPPDVVEECVNDEAKCRQTLEDTRGSKKKAEILKFSQIRFFLDVKDCAKSFALPVVALHNNDIADTTRYLAKKDAVGVSDLKGDVDRSSKATGEDKVKEIKAAIDKKFGTEEFDIVVDAKTKKTKKFTLRKLLMDTQGKTNIFRWCASPALAKCHIGDPDNPDRVVWATNSKDFDALSKRNINVALQSSLASAVGTDAETDLSTMFLVVQDRLTTGFEKIINHSAPIAAQEMLHLMQLLSDMFDSTKAAEMDGFETMLDLLVTVVKLRLRLEQMGAAEQGREAAAKISFLNIETPHNLPKKSDAEVKVANYEFIVEVMKAAGFHCCGKDPAAAEKSIKDELGKEPAPTKGK